MAQLLLAEPKCTTAFCVLIVMTGTLLTRPMDLFGSEFPLFLYLGFLCLLLGYPAILAQLTPRNLSIQPITAMVLGLLVCVVLSQVKQLNISSSLAAAIDFFRGTFFYLLVAGLLNSSSRLRLFLFWLVVFVMVLAGLALLQYHELISIPTLVAASQSIYDEDGRKTRIARLQSVGLYGDPNDLCLILSSGMIACLFFFSSGRRGLGRFIWLVPFGVFGYAVALTHSRGGTMGLVMGMLVLFRSRYGMKSAVVATAIAIPVISAVFTGRGTAMDLTNSSDTSQSRIQFWSMALEYMKESPFLGVGYGGLSDLLGGAVAHNSFVQCFAELGILGGTLFFGVFYLIVLITWRMSKTAIVFAEPELAQFRPYLLALTVAFVVGAFSLTRSYTVTTYIIPGFAAAYFRTLFRNSTWVGLKADARLAVHLGIAGIFWLIFIYVFVRVFANFG